MHTYNRICKGISCIPLKSAISSWRLQLLFCNLCPFYSLWTTYLGFPKLCSSGSAPLWMFLPLNILSEYWIEHVTFRLFYVMFGFSIRIFYRRVPDFATDCPCGVWCRGLTTCLLYVGPLFGNGIGFCKCDIMENNFFIVFSYVSHISYCLTIWYFIFIYLILVQIVNIFYIVLWYSPFR